MKYWSRIIALSNQHKYFLVLLRTIRLLSIIAVVLLLGKYTNDQDNDKRRASKVLPIVILATAKAVDVPVYLDALGSVIPTKSVMIKPRVSGQLLHVFFQEGQMVQEQELIAEIDDKPYKAVLMQYEGQLLRDKALLENAKIELERYQKLSGKNAVSKQVLDKQVSLVKQYEGTVQSGEGLAEAARINLGYCRITSPIAGQVGLSLIDPGNFVQTADPSGIVVVNTINPITVVFSLPEDSLQQITSGEKLKVEAYDRWQNKLLAIGVLSAIDNQVDPTTGTFKLKAEFANDKQILFPKQFVNVRLLVKTLRDSTTIPTAAINRGIKGTYIYLANNDETVKITYINTGPTIGDDTVVTRGVNPGERIVVEGLDKLTDGAKISVSKPKSH